MHRCGAIRLTLSAIDFRRCLFGGVIHAWSLSRSGSAADFCGGIRAQNDKGWFCADVLDVTKAKADKLGGWPERCT
jgi:hypothetical protein